MEPQKVGTMLRAAREKRGLDIAECAKQTGLPHEYLEALESGDLDRLPGLAYARIYFFNYARMLGLNAEELPVLWPEPRPLQMEPVKRRGWPLLVGVPLVAAAMVGAGFIMMRSAQVKDGSEAEREPRFTFAAPGAQMKAAPPSADSAGSSVPAPTGRDSVTVIAGAADGRKSEPLAGGPVDSNSQEADSATDSPILEPLYGPVHAPEAFAQDSAGADVHRLVVVSRGQTWIRIQADADTAVDQVIYADDSISAMARREFMLWATRPGILSVKLDGARVNLPPRGGRSLVGHRIVPAAEDST